MSFLREVAENSVSLDLYIQPKASKNTVCGLHGSELKLAITAPPVDGKANKAVIAYLAELFGVAKSSVIIMSGQQSRHKRCVLQGVTFKEAGRIVNSFFKFQEAYETSHDNQNRDPL
ncbi:MAG: YggU family protein [Desulfobacterales bacterium]|nr:MAG: YggU family protein [Desulfobacterales bacterium]